MAYCGKCIHLDVCKSADACDGHVPRCKHFMDKTEISQALEKPATMGDWLRTISDRKLAEFWAAKFSDHHAATLETLGKAVTATELSSVAHTWFSILMQLFRQPAEEVLHENPC